MKTLLALSMALALITTQSTAKNMIEFHNPGSIRYDAKNKWVGQTGKTKSGFSKFENPVYGIRAMAVLLMAYQDRHRANTVGKIVKRYAPPHENDTLSYILHVSGRLGVVSDEVINVHEYRYMRPLIEAIIQFENGEQPYTGKQIDRALALAGILPDDADMPSRTMTGGRVATTGLSLTSVAVVAEQVQDAWEPVSFFMHYLKSALLTIKPYSGYMLWSAIGVTAIAVGAMMYARWDDARKMIR